MIGFKKKLLFIFIFLFTACGGQENRIDSSRGFDMWEYMTSASSYDVEYDIYENGLKVDYYRETHKQYGSEYERISNGGTTTLFLNADRILMDDPNGRTSIIRFLHLGDSGIFQSSSIELCSLERFYENYHNKGHDFYNVLQVVCTSKNGIYQEFYYAYNEGIVRIYEEDHGNTTEYAKISEREIF